jgi:hypothetical protein
LDNQAKKTSPIRRKQCVLKELLCIFIIME